MVFVSSISFLHSRMTFSNTSFSRLNVCSGCPVIPVKAAVAASFFSFTDAATAFSALATFSSLVAPRNSAAWTSHNFCTVSSGVPPCRSSCSACMISAGSTSSNSFTKSVLTFSSSSPALSRSRYVLICSTRVLCSMISSFPNALLFFVTFYCILAFCRNSLQTVFSFFSYNIQKNRKRICCHSHVLSFYFMN